MRVLLVVLVITAGALTTACGRGGPAAPAPLAPVPIDARLLTDDSGGIADSVQIVIRDLVTLEGVWARATSKQNPPPPIPQVDFERQMLLLVAIGRKQPEIELRVDSTGVRRELMADGRRDMLTVTFVVTDGCRRFNRDAYPLEIVRVRRFDGDVRFVGRRERTGDCP